MDVTKPYKFIGFGGHGWPGPNSPDKALAKTVVAGDVGLFCKKYIFYILFDPGPGEPGGSREAPEMADAVNSAVLGPIY